MTNLVFPRSSYQSLCKNFAKPGSRKFAYATTIETMLDTAGNPFFIIRHHSSTIAVIGADKVAVSNAGWSSRTTIDRINRVLNDNGAGYFACIRQGESKFINRDTDEMTDMPYNEFVTYLTN